MGRVVSWEVEKVREGSEVARWEKWESSEVTYKLLKVKGFGTVWNSCMACGLLWLNPEA